MGSAWSHHGNRLAVQAAELSSTGAIVANVLMVREPDGLERVVGRCRSASTDAPCELLPVDWTPDDSAILVTSRVSDDPRSRLTLWSAKAQDPVDAPIGTLVSDAIKWNVSTGCVLARWQVAGVRIRRRFQGGEGHRRCASDGRDA